MEDQIENEFTQLCDMRNENSMSIKNYDDVIVVYHNGIKYSLDILSILPEEVIYKLAEKYHLPDMSSKSECIDMIRIRRAGLILGKKSVKKLTLKKSHISAYCAFFTGFVLIATAIITAIYVLIVYSLTTFAW